MAFLPMRDSAGCPRLVISRGSRQMEAISQNGQGGLPETRGRDDHRAQDVEGRAPPVIDRAGISKKVLVTGRLVGPPHLLLAHLTASEIKRENDILYVAAVGPVSVLRLVPAPIQTFD